MNQPVEPLGSRFALFTDLYELTMAQAYVGEGMEDPAVFELYFRNLPQSRTYIIAAGLADVLSYLQSFRFSDDDIAFLRQRSEFSVDFLNRLANLRFTGDVFAVPEGTIVFPNEPLVQVIAPIVEAQLVETWILNQIHFQSVAATKASRVVTAAAGRNVVDFGSRRAHGVDAALKVARTSYLAGADGTSNVLAGKLYGVPVFGTMAHSFIQAHEDEAAAFEAFVRLYDKTTILVDTYDTLAGVRKLIDLLERFEGELKLGAVRLDSGDLARLAKQTRQMLDEAGLRDVRIFASGGLDEYKIQALLEAGAPIDGFGVGTNLAVSDDAPSLDMAYKLVEYAGRPRMKLSSEKLLHPGRKQVFRWEGDEDRPRDVIGRFDEQTGGRPLLEHVMQSGEPTALGAVTLADARRHAQSEMERLPPSVQSGAYPVEFSASLERLRKEVSGSVA